MSVRHSLKLCGNAEVSSSRSITDGEVFSGTEFLYSTKGECLNFLQIAVMLLWNI